VGIRSFSAADRPDLRAGLACAGEQLLVGRAAEAPFHVGDAVEVGLDPLEAVGLGLQRREERAQLAGGLAKSELGVAELVGGALELWGEALQWREGALGLGD